MKDSKIKDHEPTVKKSKKVVTFDLESNEQHSIKKAKASCNPEPGTIIYNNESGLDYDDKILSSLEEMNNVITSNEIISAVEQENIFFESEDKENISNVKRDGVNQGPPCQSYGISFDSTCQNLESGEQDFKGEFPSFNPEYNTPLLLDNGMPSTIKPIFSSVKTYSDIVSLEEIENFDKIDDDNISREELLNQLKELASDELKSLTDLGIVVEETKYNPPNIFVKQPLDYLREAVVADNGSFTSKLKQKRMESANSDPENGIDFKSFNDFDEELFRMDQTTKTFNCPWSTCNKSFPSLSRIKRHYIIHTDIKPFKCLNEECSREFSRKDNMLQHCRVHCPYTTKSKSIER